MNPKNFPNIFYLILVLLCLHSCNKEENTTDSPQLLIVEGEGGTYKVEVSMLHSGWNIAEVINKNGDARISGEIYSTDGKLITENSPLAMKGQGRIEADWGDKGFIITRSSADSLIIEVLENGTGEPFNFGIILQDNQAIHEIVIRQKASEGYQYSGIEYQVKEGDRDSLFTRKGMSFIFNLITPQTFSFSPYNGIDIVNNSYFESDDAHAFIWIAKDSVLVNVPQSITEGKIYLSDKENVYGVITRTPYMHGNPYTASLEIPAGKEMKFHVELEYRERIVSYVLTLINNRNKSERKVEGKWIEITPTGNYNIVKNW